MDMEGKVGSGVCSVVGHSNQRTGYASPEYAIPRIIPLDSFTTHDQSAWLLHFIVHNQAPKSFRV